MLNQLDIDTNYSNAINVLKLVQDEKHHNNYW